MEKNIFEKPDLIHINMCIFIEYIVEQALYWIYHKQQQQQHQHQISQKSMIVHSKVNDKPYTKPTEDQREIKRTRMVSLTACR